MSDLARMIERYIYGLQAERRIYPDLYAEELAEKVRKHIEEENDSE